MVRLAHHGAGSPPGARRTWSDQASARTIFVASMAACATRTSTSAAVWIVLVIQRARISPVAVAARERASQASLS